jgi:transposase-like protein
MMKHRSHSAAFKRQVAEEFIAGETLHGLSQRHDLSRQPICIWVGKFEAGALDDWVGPERTEEFDTLDRGCSEEPDEAVMSVTMTGAAVVGVWMIMMRLQPRRLPSCKNDDGRVSGKTGREGADSPAITDRGPWTAAPS